MSIVVEVDTVESVAAMLLLLMVIALGDETCKENVEDTS